MPRLLFFLVVLAVSIGLVACGNTTFSSAANDDTDGSAGDGSTDGSTGRSDGGSNDSSVSSDGSIDGPVTLYTGQNNPNDLLVVGDQLYWTNYAEDGGTSTVARGAVDGTLASAIATATHANRLASDGTNIYFSDLVSAHGDDGFVASVAITGGNYAKLYQNLVSPMGVAVYNGMVYVATFYGQGSSAGEIQSISTADNSTGPPITGLNNPVSVVAGGIGLGWTEMGSGTAPDGKATFAGLNGIVTGVQMALTAPEGITATMLEYDFTALGGSSSAGGVVATSAPNGNDVNPMGFDTSSARPYFITNDGTTLFWTEAGSGAADGSIRYAAIADHKAHILVANQVDPRGIAFDASYVYWTSYSTGIIYRVAKP